MSELAAMSAEAIEAVVFDVVLMDQSGDTSCDWPNCSWGADWEAADMHGDHVGFLCERHAALWQ
jgi:hypothetical protein